MHAAHLHDKDGSRECHEILTGRQKKVASQVPRNRNSSPEPDAQDNIQQVLENTAKVEEHLKDLSDELLEGALVFKKNANKLHNHLWKAKLAGAAGLAACAGRRGHHAPQSGRPLRVRDSFAFRPSV